MPRPIAPTARIVPQTTKVHGETRVDDYGWLRNRDDRDVLAYLEAENAYTEAMTEHLATLRETLYREMRGRIKETDSSAPFKKGDFWYYSRTESGKQYPIYCRKYGTLEAPEAVILDQNTLAEGHEYCRLGVLRVSPDHRVLAYSLDTAGSEVYTLLFKDLENGRLLGEKIPNTYYSAEWSNDGAFVFYTVLDEAKRPFRVMRHAMGTDVADDVDVFRDMDDAFFVSLSKTRSESFILISSESKTTSEVHFIAADSPLDAPQVVHSREAGLEYEVAHHDDRFFIVTNHEATNFQVMEAPVSAPRKTNWVAFLPYQEAIKVDAVDAFQSHLVVWQREHGLTGIRVVDLQSGEVHTVSHQEPVYTVTPGDNPEFETSVLRFRYSSLVTPPSVCDYDMRTRETNVVKRTEILGGYDPAHYESERITVTASDGTAVPVSLVYRKPLVRDGTRPALLYGYGSYGISIDPAFGSERVSLLDRGFLFAIAHLRGGGELGRTWYERGKLFEKEQTFSDFIDAADHLISNGYTKSDRLAIRGGSAGGMLMGTVVNRRPDLFRAVVAEVPFVDVINTMLDPTLPLTVTEYDEWGNPGDGDVYAYMRAYSPYDNVRRQAYPNILVTAGLNDPRVQYWEPAKWTAKLRTAKTDDNVLLLKTNMGAGHAGASGRYDRLRELAFWMAFVIDRVTGNR